MLWTTWISKSPLFVVAFREPTLQWRWEHGPCTNVQKGQRTPHQRSSVCFAGEYTVLSRQVTSWQCSDFIYWTWRTTLTLCAVTGRLTCSSDWPRRRWPGGERTTAGTSLTLLKRSRYGRNTLHRWNVKDCPRTRWLYYHSSELRSRMCQLSVLYETNPTFSFFICGWDLIWKEAEGNKPLKLRCVDVKPLVRFDTCQC